MSRANKLLLLVSRCTWSASSPKGAVLCTTSCGEDLCHHRQVATSIASVWIQIDFSAQKLLKIHDKRQKAQWKLDLMEQQAESYARLSSCSSLKPGGKKLSSKIGFVLKGELLHSPPPPLPPLILSNYEVSGREEKQKAIGPNWQDGTTLSGTCYAKLLKNRCFPRYFLPLDASEFPLNGQYIEEPTLQKSVFFAIRCLSYLGVSVSLLSRGHFPRLYTGFTGARGFFVPSNKL